MTGKKSIIGIIVLIAALLILIEIVWYFPYFFMAGGIGSFLSESDTEFQMRKVVVCTECDTQYIYTVVNITSEELKKYPTLESALNGEICVEYVSGTDSWLCKVTHDDWEKIKDFIDSKRTRDNGTAPFCFNFGKMYGDACYSFAFVKP